MNNILDQFRSEFQGTVPKQVDHATVDGNVLTIPESVAHLDPELSQAALDQQEVFDRRALARALEPVLEAGNFHVVGTVGGAQAAVQVAPVPRTIDYNEVPVGALMLADSAQSSPGSVVKASRWKYTTDEEARTVTLYPNSDHDTQISRVLNDLTPYGWQIIECYENRADASVKDPVIIKAPPGYRVKTREGFKWETTLSEAGIRHYIELDRKLRNEEKN